MLKVTKRLLIGTFVIGAASAPSAAYARFNLDPMVVAGRHEQRTPAS
jgi:hypothetical protein